MSSVIDAGANTSSDIAIAREGVFYLTRLQVIQEESYEDGVKAGYDKGENALAELYDWLFENNRVSDVQKANKDSKYRKDLFDEYVASKKKN